MARGLSLFNDIVEDTKAPEQYFRGRNKQLRTRRDELIIDRLYHFKKMFRFEYERVLEILSIEFFLTDVTIPQILQKDENQAYAFSLRKTQPTKQDFQKKWPHLVWEEKQLLSIYGTVSKTA